MPSTHRSAKKLDRRVVRTRKAIMQAFVTLVCRGELDKITVSAIAREAGIDRKTFYLHYRSVDELVGLKAEEFLERILKRVQSEGANKSHPERIHIVLEEMNAIISASMPFYTSLASQLSTDQALDLFKRASDAKVSRAELDPEIKVNEKLNGKIKFFVAGTVYLYLNWLRSDLSQPIESVSEAIDSAVSTL